MQNIQIFNNEEFGEVRILIDNDELWFVGNDVAKALGYSKVRDAIKTNVDEMDTSLMGVTDSMGRTQQTSVINESGLYSMIFGSKLETAKRFKRWVTSEVLPTLRKNGAYSMVQKCPLDAAVAGNVADLGRVTERIMKSQNSAPHKIAEAFLLECSQFGIILPTDFVKIPEYEQMELMIINETKKE